MNRVLFLLLLAAGALLVRKVLRFLRTWNGAGAAAGGIWAVATALFPGR